MTQNWKQAVIHQAACSVQCTCMMLKNNDAVIAPALIMKIYDNQLTIKTTTYK